MEKARQNFISTYLIMKLKTTEEQFFFNQQMYGIGKHMQLEKLAEWVLEEEKEQKNMSRRRNKSNTNEENNGNTEMNSGREEFMSRLWK